MHGGGNGYYTPITGSLAAGFTPRPEYFGMQLAEKFSGSILLQTTLQCSSDRVRAYASEKVGNLQFVVINKTEQPVQLAATLPKTHIRPEVWELSGPALDQKDGVAFMRHPSLTGPQLSFEVAPHSAMLWLM